MAIDVTQIHNIVRTYHRALDEAHDRRAEPAASDPAVREDRVSVSREARRRSEQAQTREGTAPRS